MLPSPVAAAPDGGLGVHIDSSAAPNRGHEIVKTLLTTLARLNPTRPIKPPSKTITTTTTTPTPPLLAAFAAPSPPLHVLVLGSPDLHARIRALARAAGVDVPAAEAAGRLHLADAGIAVPCLLRGAIADAERVVADTVQHAVASAAAGAVGRETGAQWCAVTDLPGMYAAACCEAGPRPATPMSVLGVSPQQGGGEGDEGWPRPLRGVLRLLRSLSKSVIAVDVNQLSAAVMPQRRPSSNREAGSSSTTATKPSKKRPRSPAKDLIAVLPIGVLSFIFSQVQEPHDATMPPPPSPPLGADDEAPKPSASASFEAVVNDEFTTIFGPVDEAELLHGTWISRIVHPDDQAHVSRMLGYADDTSRQANPRKRLMPSDMSAAGEAVPPKPVLGVRFQYRVRAPSASYRSPAALEVAAPEHGLALTAGNAGTEAETRFIWLSAENTMVPREDEASGTSAAPPRAPSQMVLHTVMDITPLKAAEVERMVWARAAAEHHRERARQAKRRKEEIDEFVDVLCHELRNPLNGIAGNVDLLRSGLEVREGILQELERDGVVSVEAVERLRQQLRDDEESVAAIHACAEHSRMVADDVLELGLLESGSAEAGAVAELGGGAAAQQQMLRSLPFDPKVVLNEVARMLGARASLKGLGIRLNFPLEDVLCYGDQQKLRQVVVNLVSNAIVHCERGSITVTLDVVPDPVSASPGPAHITAAASPEPGAFRIEALGSAMSSPSEGYRGLVKALGGRGDAALGKPANATLRVSVIDTGVGMTPEEMWGLFRKFAQPTQPLSGASAVPSQSLVGAHGGVAGGPGGSGLGLLICKRLVESMGGTMSVESAKGKGARFSFTVRIALVDASPARLDHGLPLPFGAAAGPLATTTAAALRGMAAAYEDAMLRADFMASPDPYSSPPTLHMPVPVPGWMPQATPLHWNHADAAVVAERVAAGAAPGGGVGEALKGMKLSSPPHAEDGDSGPQPVGGNPAGSHPFLMPAALAIRAREDGKFGGGEVTTTASGARGGGVMAAPFHMMM
ncbi:hypothetical protein HDU96_002436 [Phlyctochytrium bullatum]|nr:hypothetical protein HDU96_002436 [Phlyctochytrium bullatum]